MLMSVGWDFTFLDGIRDRNTGIWKSISLYATDKAAIRNPFIRSELAKPGYDKAEETVSARLLIRRRGRSNVSLLGNNR